MSRKTVPAYARDDRGAATIEFVVVASALLIIIFFVAELTLIYFSVMAEQKAAEVGVRLAAVSDPVATGVPATNVTLSTGINGGSCGTANTCTNFGTLTCDKGTSGCVATSFATLLTRMQQFMTNLTAANVTVTYSYQNLGYAGGKVVPVVTVTIKNVPFNTSIVNLITGGAFSKLPTVSATMTGEDLSTSGS